MVTVTNTKVDVSNGFSIMELKKSPIFFSLLRIDFTYSVHFKLKPLIYLNYYDNFTALILSIKATLILIWDSNVQPAM